MENKLVFSKIKKDNIFCPSFENFTDNNTIEFSRNGIAVIYGPNGTGKTSLARVLNCEENCNFNLKYEQVAYNEQNKELFHVINDQNSRNIIKGTTEDFLLGDNIKKEFELQRYIEKEMKDIFERIVNSLKKEFNIAKKSSELLKQISNENLRIYISDLTNNKSKGNGINKDDFLNIVSSINIQNEPVYIEKKLKFTITDYEEKNSVLKKIFELNEILHKNEKIAEVEEHDEAIRILKKFDYKNECIVCDTTGINSNSLLKLKESKKGEIYRELDEKTKKILEDIIQVINDDDPFCIKNTLMDAIKCGDNGGLENLKKEIKFYLMVLDIKVNNLFANCLQGSDLYLKYNEYQTMIMSKPALSDEDILFIERIINENIEKTIELLRDENNNLKLLLDNKEFLNLDRNHLHLSNGEQNFISLAFELLKAKNSPKKIIVLDDPISSFDSIYKNKITFSIVKFLEAKKQIILTHNTELIKLLEHQKQKCFKLYLFNNTLEEENGFIAVNNNEQQILLYLDKLLDLFRNEILNEVKDEKTFLISMIPFMRGYAQITNYKNEKNDLTKLMHGYQEEKVNITEIYNTLFNTNLKTPFEISAKVISNLNIKNLEILKEAHYPLLNKTLRHTLIYLYLRLNVEQTLVALFNINTKKYDMLSSIIFKSFNQNTEDHNRRRIFLASRKTLLNEFNHFEGNMNIFQPAIDISDTALKKECDSIMQFLEEISLTPVG